ncbi:hypothetical protein BGX29_006211, partial [Mortierella sp. GBA35]
MADNDASTLASTTVVPPPDLSKKLPWYKRLDQQRGILLIVISLAQMLDIISIASVTIALPSILRDVHYAPNQLQWVVSSYALTYSAFLLVGGRMSVDSQETPSSCPSLVAFKAQVLDSQSCIGQTIGVLLGGIFDATIGWYWIFYITAIISALLCVAGFFVISKANDDVHVTDRRVDIVGVLSFMIGIIAVVYYLS